MATLIDKKSPTAKIRLSDTKLEAGETAVVSIKFSEIITDFTLSDLKVKYGTLSDLSTTDNINWTALFSPTDGVYGVGQIQLASRSVKDLAGNGNSFAYSPSYKVITKDITAPKATINISDSKLTSAETAVVSIKFSEAVTGFTLSDMRAYSATLSDLTTTDNINWTAVLTPKENVKSYYNYVTLVGKSVMDLASNYNKIAYSNYYSVSTKDTVAPTVTLSLASTSLNVGETTTLSLVFSEAVKLLTLSDFSLTNGTLSDLTTLDNITWTATLTPTENLNATGSIVLKAKSLTDMAGNYNASATTTSFALNTLVVPDTTDTTGSTTTDTTTDTTPSGSTLAPLALLKSTQVATYQSSEFLAKTSTIIQSLVSGDKWSSSSPTYSFNSSLPSEYKGEDATGCTASGNLTTGWTAVTSTVQSVVDEIMVTINEYTGLTLSKSSTTGDIRFNMVPTANDIAAFAYYPGKTALDGDVFIDTGITELWVGGYGYSTVVHELGHSLGLKHPFEEGTILPTAQDNGVNTIMSYTDYRPYVPEIVTTTKASGASSVNSNYDTAIYPSTFAVYDIAALQSIYGVNASTKTGNDTYSYGTTPAYNTIWDAGGIDTIDLSQTTYSDIVNLASGSYSSINYRSLSTQIAEQQAIVKAAVGSNTYNTWVSNVYNDYSSDVYTGEHALGIAYGTIIENVIGGSANDTFYDNSVDNIIYGGNGNDVFYLGSGGYDSIYGDAGTDKLILSNVTKSSVQLEKEATGETLLLASNFAVKLVGVETIQFSDQVYTVS